MKQLGRDWLTNGIVDFEYKKYILLAYLKHIRRHFILSELYPFLADLVFHFRNLQQIKENKELLFKNFPKSISKVDFEKLKISYQTMIQNDEMMDELESIIAFAIPQIDSTIKEGRELYEFVESNMEITPVGLMPLYKNEGYLLLNQDAKREVRVYRYRVSVFESSEEKYRSIATTFLSDDFVDFSRSYETIKIDLVRNFNEMPNPATYLVACKMGFPEIETVVPIAKRLLIESISLNS